MATAPQPQIDSSFFFRQIARADESVLILDFDTTLAHFVAAPPSRSPWPTVLEIIDCIMMAGRTRVVVATRYAACHVTAQFGISRPEIWASDGLERILAAPEAANISLCLRPSKQGVRRALIDELGTLFPTAYLAGDAAQVHRSSCDLLVRPELHLRGTKAAPLAPEGLVQFLLDWLRACVGEVC